MKICKHCGGTFEPKNPKGKYCSDKCRVYGNRKKVVIDYIPLPIITSKENIEKINQVFYEVGHSQLNKPKTLDELKALCPPELKGFYKSTWIATERQKYNI